MAPGDKIGVISASSAAWRKVIANPLKRRKRAGLGEKPSDDGTLSDDSINSIIEGEILPRLLMAHSSGNAPGMANSTSEIHPTDANRFATLPLTHEAASLLEEVDAYLDEGVSVEAIYLDLLAPAARRLGEMWEADTADFVDVTMGLWRLQEVMREVASKSPPIIEALSAPHTALFAPMPGDQHTFGAIMIEDVFARAGWNSEILPRPERRELLDTVAARAFDVVGLTLSRDCPSAAIASLLKAIRGVSANPHVSILIGGRMVNQNPAIVAEVGADGTGVDARDALKVAERLVLAEPMLAPSIR